MTSAALLHRDEILRGLAEGKRLSDLNLPLSPQAISKALTADPEYRAALETGFHKRLDVAEKAIEAAADSVDVARAKARFQSVAWRAEREFPERWGAKTTSTVDATLTIQVVRHGGEGQNVGQDALAAVPQSALPAPEK